MYKFLDYRVSEFMTGRPTTIDGKTPLAKVESIFESFHFNGLPVVDEGQRLRGFLTKLDVLRAFAFTPQSIVPHYEEAMAHTAEEFMTGDPVTVSPDTPLTRVLELLVRTRYKSFPVVREDRLVGIIAREDLLRALRRAAGRETA
jgi:CBS domain-containing protein